MKIELSTTKTGVFGIQGSGKTYIVEHELVKAYKHPIVYLIHKEDFKTCKKNVSCYVPEIKMPDGTIALDRSPEHFNSFLGLILKQIKGNFRKCDCLIIDEADLFIPKDMRTLQHYGNILDLMDNHRHYGMGIIYISRRPQDINTGFVETSEHLFLFAIEGKNVIQHFKCISADYDDLIPQLNKDRHNFIYKKIGSVPTLHSGFNK